MVVVFQPAHLAQFYQIKSNVAKYFHVSCGDDTLASKIIKFEFSKSIFAVKEWSWCLNSFLDNVKLGAP